MTTNAFDHLWNDPRNWRAGAIYHCKQDPRVIVPKRPQWMGRTLNFAHGKAYVLLAATLLIALLPVLLALAFGAMESPAWVIAQVVGLVGVVVFYYRADIRA